METTGAVESFLHSVKKRNLKYKIFLGDGDTDCFATVASECKKAFGQDYIVVKKECVGHIQKRLGTALRKYKNEKRGKIERWKICWW